MQLFFIVFVQLLNRVWFFAIPWTSACQAVIHCLPEFVQTHVHWIGCHPVISFSVVPFSSCLQSFPTGSFPVELALRITWPKYWSFCISPSNAYSELISYRIDWFDLLAVHGNLKSLQHYSSKTSVLHAQPSLWSNSHIWTWLWKNHSFDCMDLCEQSNVSTF